jgi:hypothetical protein
MKNNNNTQQVAYQLRQQQQQQQTQKQQRAVADSVKERNTSAPSSKQVDQYLLLKEAQASAARSAWNKPASAIPAQKMSQFKQSRQQNYSASSLDDDRVSLQGWSEAERDVDANSFARSQQQPKSQQKQNNQNGKKSAAQQFRSQLPVPSSSVPQQQQKQQQPQQQQKQQQSQQVQAKNANTKARADKPNPKRQFTTLTLADLRRQPQSWWMQNGVEFDAFAALAATPSRKPQSQSQQQQPQQQKHQQQKQQQQQQIHQIKTQQQQPQQQKNNNQRSQLLRSPSAVDSPKHATSPLSLDQIRKQPSSFWEQNGLALEEFQSVAVKSAPLQQQQKRALQTAQAQPVQQQLQRSRSASSPRRPLTSPVPADSPKHVASRLTLADIRREKPAFWEQNGLELDLFASFAAVNKQQARPQQQTRPAQQQQQARPAQQQQQQRPKSGNASAVRRIVSPTASDSSKHVLSKLTLAEIRRLPQAFWELNGLDWDTFVALNVQIRTQNKASRPNSRSNSNASMTKSKSGSNFAQQAQQAQQAPKQQPAQPAKQTKGALTGFFDIFDLLSGR